MWIQGTSEFHRSKMHGLGPYNPYFIIPHMEVAMGDIISSRRYKEIKRIKPKTRKNISGV
jgi:hypothetical protein